MECMAEFHVPCVVDGLAAHCFRLLCHSLCLDAPLFSLCAERAQHGDRGTSDLLVVSLFSLKV